MLIRKQFLLLLSMCYLIPLYHASANLGKNQLSIWPKAEKGYQRFVIQLPPLSNEYNARVELIPQKKIKSDCNTVIIHGHMTTQTIQGWGYDFYRLDKISKPASTLMACPQNIEQEKQVSITTNLTFINYNSKLPLVVYVPDDITLAYRIWTSSSMHQARNK
ncbi:MULTISPECIES: ecotin [Commensalibacter]|uniref:ecotin n=1 Tax=Commensalibacter TaxID=1079922 RepID=UPI0018C296C9|nr:MULTISPECIES: ecotin family protein [Commensalibacter]